MRIFKKVHLVLKLTPGCKTVELLEGNNCRLMLDRRIAHLVQENRAFEVLPVVQFPIQNMIYLQINVFAVVVVRSLLFLCIVFDLVHEVSALSFNGFF